MLWSIGLEDGITGPLFRVSFFVYIVLLVFFSGFSYLVFLVVLLRHFPFLIFSGLFQ